MKFKWTKIEQYAFNEIKRIAARDTLLTDPDFNETLKIHTDANNLQLWAVISQKGNPIDFYGRNFMDAQRRYTVTEG